MVLDRILSLAVKSAKPDIVRFLCDRTDVEVGRLGTGRVGGAVEGEEVGRVRGVLEVLVERGWGLEGGGGGGVSFVSFLVCLFVCLRRRGDYCEGLFGKDFMVLSGFVYLCVFFFVFWAKI